MIKLKVYKLKDGIAKPINTSEIELITEKEILDDNFPETKDHQINKLMSKNKFYLNDIVSIEFDNYTDFYAITKLGAKVIDIEIIKEQSNPMMDIVLKNIEENEKTDIIQNENVEVTPVVEETIGVSKQKGVELKKTKSGKKKKQTKSGEKQYIRLWDKIAEIQANMENKKES